MGGCASKAPKAQPLSMEQLLKARMRLESRNQLSPELKACFNLALSEFSQEPICIQENARVTIQSGPTVLLFASGSQENKIHVFQVDGQVQYDIKVARWGACAARACSRATLKSVAEMLSYVPLGPAFDSLKTLWDLHCGSSTSQRA